jgi:hypothetical protein
MKWDKHSFADAVCVSENQKSRFVHEVKQYLEQHPGEPFFFTGTGDAIICGFAHDNGEMIVFECKVLNSYTAERKPESPTLIVRGTRKGTP